MRISSVARGAEVLRSDPAKAAAILNDNPRAVGRVLGEAAATAAMAKFDAGGTGCSFDADTPVATLDGQRAIGALEVGDTVLAFNAATGMLEADPITHVWVNHDPAIERLTLSAETLDTTPEHPFFTRERGWVAAGEARPVVMYNLTVARAHTFFVGDEGWLVHNACGPVRGGKGKIPLKGGGTALPKGNTWMKVNEIAHGNPPDVASKIAKARNNLRDGWDPQRFVGIEIVEDGTKVAVNGNHRLSVAREMGYDEIPARVLLDKRPKN